MFGIDVLNSVPVSHILMGESITYASEFDREPSEGNEGKYATVNWDASVGKYQVTVDGETKSTSYGDGRADFLKEFGQFIHGFKGYGVKFNSLSPSDSSGTEVPTMTTPEEEEEMEDGESKRLKLLTDKFGWINCDAFVEVGPRTELEVDLKEPSNKTYARLIFNDIK